MKKNLLIIVSRLLQGGIDTVLLEYLSHFDREKFHLTLAIGIYMEELERYSRDIPADVQVEYLVRHPSLIKYRKRKVLERLPRHIKWYDELFVNPVRRKVQRRKLNKLIRSNDIVIDFDSTFYSFLSQCPIPKIAFFHFSFKYYHHGNVRKLKRLGKKLSVYDTIITPCNEMKREGEELYPQLKERFQTIYNSFNFEKIRKKADAPVSAYSPYIVAVERLEETQKDLTTLIKAYKMLIEKNGPHWLLYIIGEGKSRWKLEKLQKELGLEDKVHFLGFLQNPYPWIKHSELFVLSSKFEGFGNVLVEAMILNTSIVSTDCPTGPKEILEYGKSGLLTPVGHVSNMAEHIHVLLTNQSLRDAIHENVTVHVENFNVKKNMRKIEVLLTKTKPRIWKTKRFRLF